MAEPRFIELYLDSDEMEGDVPSFYDLRYNPFLMVLELITPSEIDAGSSSFYAGFSYLSTTFRPLK
jgi:hypothetical protein